MVPKMVPETVPEMLPEMAPKMVPELVPELSLLDENFNDGHSSLGPFPSLFAQ